MLENKSNRYAQKKKADESLYQLDNPPQKVKGKSRACRVCRDVVGLAEKLHLGHRSDSSKCPSKGKVYSEKHGKQILQLNRIPRTGAYLRPSKNKPPCELAISRDLAN